ncbi:MAG: NYN domain-containing protein [Planctomycetota bacterium]
MTADTSPDYAGNYAQSRSLRVGVYVDVANISLNGGRGMRFDTLRRFAARDGGDAMRLAAYCSYDPERAREDSRYRIGTLDFHRIMRDFGYKVVTKTVRWYEDENGERHPKANVDMDLAVDCLSQSNRLDRVVLLSGDGDFVQLVRAVQNLGCRVEVIAFRNVSEALRNEADMFLSGYLVPGLLPVTNGTNSSARWGEVGSRVRGICYDWRSDRGFGFMRFLRNLSDGLWITDTRQSGSSFETAFVHATELERARIDTEELPSRDLILEFELTEGKKEGFEARAITVVNRYPFTT